MKRLLLVLALLLPFDVLAAARCSSEGGACTGYTSTVKGDLIDECVCLCNGNHAANEDCGEINLSASALGWPLYFTVVLHQETGCAATPEITPVGMSHTGDKEYDLVTTALTTAGKASRAFNTEHPIIKSTVADAGSCTDLEVLVIKWHKR